VHDITTCLWFDKEGKEAADFYVSVFPGSRIVQEHAPVVVFELDGTRFMALNGGPAHAGFTETVSFVVHCDTQEEIDRYWETLTADGGRESMCGWLQDRFGVSWQIVPRVLPQLLEDSARAQRVMDALLQMRKLVIADLEAA
jgi:predicted 3-demethylubiquinone-9 3-methyltransferase (glyoxalase superfamily)